MSQQSRVYKLTPVEVAAIRQKLPNVIDSGTFNPPGHPEITLGYLLASDPAVDGRLWLTLTVLHDAWYETCGEIWDAIDALMPPDAVPKD